MKKAEELREANRLLRQELEETRIARDKALSRRELAQKDRNAYETQNEAIWGLLRRLREPTCSCGYETNESEAGHTATCAITQWEHSLPTLVREVLKQVRF